MPDRSPSPAPKALQAPRALEPRCSPLLTRCPKPGGAGMEVLLAANDRDHANLASEVSDRLP